MIKRLPLLMISVVLLLLALACNALYDTSAQENSGDTVQPDTEMTVPQFAVDQISLTANQVEITESPTTITLEASESTDVRLGLMAIDKLAAPALDGHRLAAELPTDSVLLIQPDGTAFFSYADLFSRNFRNRKRSLQQIIGDEGEIYGIEDLLRLPPDVPRPKALLDLHSLDNAKELYINNDEDILWWTGEIVYKFDLGLPVESFRLSSLNGRRKTIIGDWALAQTWIDFAESRLDFQTPFAVPMSSYFADIQPFFFTGGPNGTVTSYFDTPVVAKVAVAQEAGRLLNTVQIPLETGTVRETPMKIWLWAADTLPTKWAALDEWTSIYDATANRYRIALGLDVNQPKPTLVWIAPNPDYYLDYLEFGPPETEDLWFYDLAYRKLPIAARFGMRVMYLQPPWDADAEYPLEEFLPGSNPNMELGGDDLGSGHAPRQLEISQVLGGEEGLKELVDRAHELGIKTVLWTPPAHLSNSSPLLQEHPDWLKWRNNGMPETFLYPDITGVSLNSGWFDYAVAQYRRIHEATGIDGVWMDSFLTFGILPDGREQQPHPPLRPGIGLAAGVLADGPDGGPH